MELILTAKAAENQYVGVSWRKLDQSCEVLSKRNHLLYLDTKDDSYELITTSEAMKSYKIGIFFSGLERSLKNSKYNLRQDLQRRDYGMYRMKYLRLIKIVCRSCGADVRNIFTANLPGRRKAQNCGATEIWRDTDSWYLKVEGLQYKRTIRGQTPCLRKTEGKGNWRG